MTWQRANIQSAIAYLREQSQSGDARARTVLDGLVEVLEPARRTMRLQKELAAANKTVPVHVARERRTPTDRRQLSDRRQANLGAPAGVERRRGNRRSGQDRRKA